MQLCLMMHFQHCLFANITESSLPSVQEKRDKWSDGKAREKRESNKAAANGEKKAEEAPAEKKVEKPKVIGPAEPPAKPAWTSKPALPVPAASNGPQGSWPSLVDSKDIPDKKKKSNLSSSPPEPSVTTKVSAGSCAVVPHGCADAI